MLFRVKNLTFLGVMEDAPFFFRRRSVFRFRGKTSGFFFQAKAAILRKAEAIPGGASGIGQAFRKNSSGEYFIFSQ